MPTTIYTHDLAALCLDAFESTLDKYNITLPSPEDNEKEPENEARLYGSTYSDLLDTVEEILITHLHNHNVPVLPDKFSGNI